MFLLSVFICLCYHQFIEFHIIWNDFLLQYASLTYRYCTMYSTCCRVFPNKIMMIYIRIYARTFDFLLWFIIDFFVFYRSRNVSFFFFFFLLGGGFSVRRFICKRIIKNMLNYIERTNNFPCVISVLVTSNMMSFAVFFSAFLWIPCHLSHESLE